MKPFLLQLSQHLCQSVCFVSCLFQITASATEPYCSPSAVDWTTATVGCLVAVSASFDLTTCVFCELYLHKCVIYIIFLGRIAVLRTYMLLTVSNEVAWSVGRSVCLLVCHTSHTCKTASSSGCQPMFTALNRVCHLCSAGRPSRWTFAHILVSNQFDHLFALEH